MSSFLPMIFHSQRKNKYFRIEFTNAFVSFMRSFNYTYNNFFITSTRELIPVKASISFLGPLYSYHTKGSNEILQILLRAHCNLNIFFARLTKRIRKIRASIFKISKILCDWPLFNVILFIVAENRRMKLESLILGRFSSIH